MRRYNNVLNVLAKVLEWKFSLQNLRLNKENTVIWEVFIVKKICVVVKHYENQTYEIFATHVVCN